jgi:hypothetical protein
MPGKNCPSFDYIRQCLEYRDGGLFWIPRPLDHFVDAKEQQEINLEYEGREAGTFALCGRKGHRQLKCIIVIRKFLPDRHTFRSFRSQIVYAMFNNVWVPEIDHKDTNTINDRIENLRPCTSSQNKGNMRLLKTNTSGHRGVRFKKDRNKWQARINMNRKEKHIGYFDTKEEAIEAYVKKAKEHFGEFYREE